MAGSGKDCIRWDDEGSWDKPEDNPNAGLEDNNYCRNPNPDFNDKAFCFREEPGEEYCDVPYCFPSQSDCSSSTFETDPVGNMSEDLQAACSVVRCVIDSDSNTNDSLALERADIQPNCRCPFEIWDCEFGSKGCESYDPDINTIREADYQCCSSQLKNPKETSKTASCECLVKPECDAGEIDKCNDFADYCCDEDDEQCKCDYKTKACHAALGVDSKDSWEVHEYCREAQNTCCGRDMFDDGVTGGCECDFWEPLCTAFPHKDVDSYGNACYETSVNCCGNEHCQCDLITYRVETLGYEDVNNKATRECTEASANEYTKPKRTMELESLQSIYNELGGDKWLKNTGWLTSELDHCNWYGIRCEEEYVVEINLSSNNVTGVFPSNHLSEFYMLKSLNLVNNNLRGLMAGTTIYGEVDASVFFNLRDLSYVDLSQNKLSGEVDVLFTPALDYANFSHNNFTSINSFKKFKRSHETLRVCDVSFNSIKSIASDILNNVPPNIEQFIVSNNLIHGTLPVSLQHLASLRKFDMSTNILSGELTPDFSTSYPNLQVLDLSEQYRENNIGLAGAIPEGLVNLPFLSTLRLAGNELAGGIPPVFGSFTQLKVLDLSNNNLSGKIPKELGKLGDLEAFNLSGNQLTGRIPSELANLEESSVGLNGNLKFSNPAPLELCFHPLFDLRNDSKLCPTERNALKEFYDASKGTEWTDSENWLDEYGNPCTMPWFGVKCSHDDAVTGLNLTNNGLSGQLTAHIASLRSLEVLDLSDNDIKGKIPAGVGLLSQLKMLRLNYNSFIGNAPDELANLHNLELFQIHSNRISGVIPQITLKATTAESSFSCESSFIADCGNPSEFEDSLVCEECTMCCNAQGDCYPQEESEIEEAGLGSYMSFAFVFFACIVGASCLLALSVHAFDKYKNRDLPRASIRRPSLTNRDVRYALETLGEGSVYQFFLGVSIFGWIIALATLAAQLGMLFVFVKGAVIDLSDDNVDLIYSWKCNRDKMDCRNTSDLDWQGWTVFAVLMATHLLKDIINGTKMVILSAKERHDLATRTRYFIGGTLVTTVTAFTLYVSTIYNVAIATSNTEVIANSVIILFIMDIDELLYDIFYVINTGWVKNMSLGGDNDDEQSDIIAQRAERVEGRMQRLEKKYSIQAQSIKVNRQNIELIMQHIPDLNKLKLNASISQNEYAIAPQDEYSDEEDDTKVLHL